MSLDEQDRAGDALPAEGDAQGDQAKVPWWRGAVEFVVAFAIMIAAIMAIRTFIIEPFEIPSGSMLQTIQIGDRIFSEKVSVAIDPMPDQGDIVTFTNPRDPSETLIKRVIATEGQVIDLRDGVVYVDGEPLDEPYTDGQATRPMSSDLAYPGAVVGVDENGDAIVNESGARTNAKIAYPYTVPNGYFWVMGDNRGNSADSRVIGAVSAELVTGRAVLRYWPIVRILPEEEDVTIAGFTFTVHPLSLAIGPLD